MKRNSKVKIQNSKLGIMLFAFCLLAVALSDVFAQSGGQFAITQSVIAGADRIRQAARSHWSAP